MTSSLTAQQRQALDDYEDFQTRYPKAFQGRQQRPIILDRARLEAFVLEHGGVLGVAATTPYVYFVIDLVESSAPEGTKLVHPYLRVVHLGQLEGGINVIVLATIAGPALGGTGDVVLVEQERHATGTRELELPRGFGEPGLSGEQNALRELRQETGYSGTEARWLGNAFTDSGLTSGFVNFYYVPVTSKLATEPELQEAITTTRLLSVEGVWAKILAGSIRDSFTIQAMALFEKQKEKLALKR